MSLPRLWPSSSTARPSGPSAIGIILFLPPDFVAGLLKETVELFLGYPCRLYGVGERSTNRLERGGPFNFFPYCLYNESAHILAILRSLEPQSTFHFRRKVNVQRHRILDEQGSEASCFHYSLITQKKKNNSEPT